MRLITYDCECFKYDWLVTFKDKETGQFTCIWNDNEALKACIDEDSIYIGFNSKHYDQYIIKAIAGGLSPQEVKQVNDYIIGGGQGWQSPLLDFYYQFNNVDIRDDTQQGLSLKAIEGHLFLPIRESSIPFDIDRPLTYAERRETEIYCKHDINTTEQIIDLRKSYLKNKVTLGELAELDSVKALSMTNAKLTAKMLKASPKEHNDERDYVYPDNLRKEFIPEEVFEFFDKLKDESISDEEVFKDKLEISIGDCPVTIGYGGIHGAIRNFSWEQSEDRVILNKDVGSYYPHLCTINGYTSRNIPSPKIYEDVLERRMKAKKDGDKPTADALKLVCNTTYGCLLNKYNDLYDPLMGRSVCISGQLYLLELAEHAFKEIDGLQVIQLNTDGIMVELDKKDIDKLNEICSEWENRTGFSLEEDRVAKIVQKDVNNYVEVQPDGKTKSKGGYLVKGVAPAGAFNINNNACIVATALKEFFVKGIPVEDTINACDDIFQFQIIAKAGAKYKEAYHLVDGEKQPVQKVNRVYATKNTRYGKIYKVKAENDSEAKIDSLPDHCIIDNENELTIRDVDKTFYIEMAKKRVNDFLGIPQEKPTKERTKKMASAKTEVRNVYQKLIEAREQFLASDINQSGKNMNLEFKYFELKDIVPTITKIFKDLGLVAVARFSDTVATLSIVNTDNTEEVIEFPVPFNQIQPIVSNSGKQVTNDMQALGSSITYMRRYLYLIAMDICVNDEVDGNIGANNTPAPEKKAPATPVQRQETKSAVTAPSEGATDLQIKGLKGVLKKLKEAQPDKEEFITEIVLETNTFTEVSKARCEELIQTVTKMLEG